MEKGSHAERLIGQALAMLAAVAAAVALSSSWEKWLDPLIDAGRDLYIPEHLAHGQVLYKDILYFYPPLTPYLLLPIIKLFGASLAVYTSIGILIGLASGLVVFWIGRSTAGVIGGSLAALLFAALHLAGASTWGCNFIFPYAHAATLGMLFFLATELFLVRHYVHGGTRWNLMAAGATALAASWTKIEFAAMSLALLLLLIVFFELRLRDAGAWLAAAAVSFGAVSFAFRGAPAGRDWLRDNVLASSLLSAEATHRFYRFVSGLSAWPLNLGLAVLASAVALLVVMLARQWERWNRSLPIGLLIAAAALLLGWNDLLWRTLTIAQIALLPFAFREKRSALSLLLFFSAASTSRIFLVPTPDFYGFVYAIPGELLLLFLIFEWLPARATYTRATSLLFIPLFLAVTFAATARATEAYSLKSFRVTTSRGAFFDSNGDRAMVLNELFGWLKQRRPSGMVVMPEGLTLNYFAKIDTPIAYHTFTPAETADPAAENQVIDELSVRKPEMILLVPRDMSEFGSRGFGEDYDQRLLAWLRLHYRPEREWRLPRFRLLVLERM